MRTPRAEGQPRMAWDSCSSTFRRFRAFKRRDHESLRRIFAYLKVPLLPFSPNSTPLSVAVRT